MTGRNKRKEKTKKKKRKEKKRGGLQPTLLKHAYRGGYRTRDTSPPEQTYYEERRKRVEAP
jgi:hypothetical protein